MKKLMTSILILVMAFGLSGCFGGTPKCGDSEAKDLVIQITKDELKRKGYAKSIPNLSFVVKHIRTTKHDKEIDTYQCAADLEMIGTTTKTYPITYSVESTDDGENIYVNVMGLVF